ncbi:MAG: TetR/AcrR family transcriptional regulator [Beduini sp.]|uniref:TetR/AcrR family transcriptional regulator n=1 Tax=Beduini sp. TaxID=1922300 RepID=UPI0011C9C8FD
MSRKAYSTEERIALKAKLHAIGLDLYLEKGIQNVKLPEVLKKAGISKPFFYTFYSSLGELILTIIEEQYSQIINLLELTQKDSSLTWRSKIEAFILSILHHKDQQLYILSPEEEVWLYQRLGKEKFDSFQKGQIELYSRLLTAWEIPVEIIPPQVLGNYLLTLVIIWNNAETSLPFFFHDYLDETAMLQIKLLLDHLEKIHNQSMR